MVSIERALTVEGYMSEGELSYLAEVASKCEVIVELGSWKGRSTCALAVNSPGIVLAVDVWGGSFEYWPQNKMNTSVFGEFLENVKGLENVWPVPMPSLRAASMMGYAGFSADMIFIDATHNHDEVVADIQAWSPLLKPGGIFCGHDYGFSGWPDVEVVVKKMIPKYRVIETIWTTEGCE